MLMEKSRYKEAREVRRSCMRGVTVAGEGARKGAAREAGTTLRRNVAGWKCARYAPEMARSGSMYSMKIR
jgi:hypothetical protein